VCSASVAAESVLLDAQKPLVDLAALAAAQADCPDCRRNVGSASLRAISVQLENSDILVDVTSGVMQPLLPAAFSCQIFDVVHPLAHPALELCGA
jgi:hypothetical protein